MDIDLKIVATRRPDLLGRTLESFLTVGLREFRVASATMNLDPALGSDDDAEACRAILRSHLPEATIHDPPTPSFGGAVKRLWMEAEDRPIFHLEDDWIALAPLPLDYVQKAFEDGYGAVTPLSKEHAWTKRGYEATRIKRIRVLGVKVWKHNTGVHSFGTSPKFIKGALARRMGEVMNPDLDPEKQMGGGQIGEVVQSFRSVFVTRPRKRPIIEDIGRDWRADKGIEKQIVDGTSNWVKQQVNDA
ncbi:hypothetical protein [Gymnodinialimonas hymeniacidonis]|uniref:hypothetical protein n=1 Tax=Gymnodinialimonas hymeniacidonis TaxID=3126508 RepID=UPI0034C5BA26